MPGISMPGDPNGIPATARPLTPLGRVASARFMSAMGTCPSNVMPSITAVWQDARSAGTPRAFMKAGRLASSMTLAVRPNCAFTCSTHFSQHGQPGSRCMRTGSAAMAATGIANANAANTRCGSFMSDSKVAPRGPAVPRSRGIAGA